MRRRAATPTDHRPQSFPEHIQSTPNRRSIDAGNLPPRQAPTLAVWQPRTRRRLTDEDARQITENVVGFFQRLLAWDAAERSAHPAQKLPSTSRKWL